MQELENLIQALINLQNFRKGCVRVDSTSGLTTIPNGYGILVAADCVFDTVTSNKGGAFAVPIENEEWKAGFYLPIPVSTIHLKSGVVYIGRN